MVFTRVDTSLATGFTHQQFYDFIKARIVALGGHTFFHEYTNGTDKYVIYQVVFDATKTYGTVYLRIRVQANFTVSEALYTSWNTTNNTGTHASGDSNAVTFVNTIGVDCISLTSGNECRLAILSQSVNTFFLGIVRPSYKPPHWDENSYPFAFFYQNQTNGTFLCPALNAYGNVSSCSSLVTDARMSNPHNNTQKRDVIAGIHFFSSNAGLMGKTSDDLAIGCTAAMNKFDTLVVTPNVEEYLFMHPSVGGLLFRMI